MKNVLCFLAVSAISVLPVAAQTPRPEQASDARTRSIYVSVVDSQGAGGHRADGRRLPRA